MTPFFSFLIPTRKRQSKLMKAIQSIKQSVPVDKMQIIVGVDSEELVSTTQMLNRLNLPITILPSEAAIKDGVIDPEKMAPLWNNLYKACTGTWVIPSNDDIYINGPWYHEVANAPKEAVLCYPKTYRLNYTVYHYNTTMPTPVIRHDFIKEHMGDYIPHPYDIAISEAVLNGRGFCYHFMEQCGIYHQRQADRTLPVA